MRDRSTARPGREGEIFFFSFCMDYGEETTGKEEVDSKETVEHCVVVLIKLR